jgi:peptidyl-prolyl cis-trans isomerase A (cyclophilin A)
MNPSARNEQAPATYRVRFETSKGEFTIEVNRDWAPLGAGRFRELVESGFYDGARFFRVLPGFVVQFGLPRDPAVARKWSSARLQDDPVRESNTRGAVTFATAGPNTRTTQVFINLAENRNLDGMGFAPFGSVVQGMDVVEQLYSGYGEGAPHGRGPEQHRISMEGNAYLEKSFPKLDYIRKASIL